MNPNINPEVALKSVNEFLEELEEKKMLEKHYKEGSEELDRLIKEIEGLLRAMFSDSQKRISQYYNPYSSSDKQAEYISDVKRTMNNLLSLKKELNLHIASKNEKVSSDKEEISNTSVTRHFHHEIENIAIGDLNNSKNDKSSIECGQYLDKLEEAISNIKNSIFEVANGNELDIDVEEQYIQSHSLIEKYIQKLNHDCGIHLRHKNKNKKFYPLLVDMESKKINRNNVKDYVDDFYEPLESFIEGQYTSSKKLEMKETDEYGSIEQNKGNSIKNIGIVIGLLIPSIIATNAIKSYFPNNDNIFLFITMMLVILILVLLIYIFYLWKIN